MTGEKPIPLAELGEITAGPSGSLLEGLHDGPDGIPVVTPPSITSRHTVDTRKLRRVPVGDAEKLARFAVQEGDILVVRQGSLGRLALIGAQHDLWFYGSSCVRIRPRPELIFPAYLASYLSSSPAQAELVGQALRGTVPSLNSAMLRELVVIVPSMDRQLAIVDVLADIDEEVRILHEMSDRLQALRPAIFAEMLKGVMPA
ncbi:MAG TPA: restriction endonuclease subunit S [Actinophytocola sp.]|jgi:type I restriction enzyme S subunit|uniref:restriction endonuclease subunit S n=1 Tax=Actinophytocola sp. TaxID=1872138 RepID=UPI002DF82486|nr:restriction endonuclease subunit S [Actinophytocola sp.]